jgi:hypothetical protein
VALLALAPAAQANYDVLVSFDDMTVGSQYTLQGAHLVWGAASFHLNRSINPLNTQMTRVDGLHLAPASRTTTELTNPTQWQVATGNANALAGNGTAVVDGVVYTLDVATGGIYQTDIDTGAMSTFVSSADVQAHTGAPSNFVDATAVDPNGDLAFYDEGVDAILLTQGAGAVTTLVSNATLETEIGSLTNYVSGGMAFDDAGRLYFSVWLSGTQQQKGIWRYDPDSQTLESIVNETDIVFGLTYGATPPFQNITAKYFDIHYGEDGLIYFWEGQSKGLIRFDPEDPNLGTSDPNSLEYFITPQEFAAGPANNGDQSLQMGMLGWWKDGLTFSSGLAGAQDLFWKSTGALPGDANYDDVVDVGDLGILAGNWGTTEGGQWKKGDYNGDGAVDVGDLGILAGNWGSSAVPEPTALALLTAGWTVTVLRRRRRT